MPQPNKTQARLIPVNPHDEAERELLRVQRIICGWKAEKIPKMCDQMRNGKRLLLWVCIPSNEPIEVSANSDRGAMVYSNKHVLSEETIKIPLHKARDLSALDSPMVNHDAVQNGTEVQSDLLPVGHISIDAGDFDECPSDILFPPDGKTLSITTLFILHAYRADGLGTWAMQECERLIKAGIVVPPPTSSTSDAASERKCKVITLSTLSRRHRDEDGPDGRGMFERAGRPQDLQKMRYLGDWYKVLGYEEYHTQRKWLLHDTSGEALWQAEFWRKEV